MTDSPPAANGGREAFVQRVEYLAEKCGERFPRRRREATIRDQARSTGSWTVVRVVGYRLRKPESQLGRRHRFSWGEVAP
ncbi:hypothetical protein RHA1_ro00501 [Rhodococcus jostii RHA1]|uniref:Uncharacterized protein n=1 Tax=Rhodococcus jostii (strain RHA1) TaxID=101510 RepID=Q0SJE9_RHOJR|nr:hypothetical protein RHA1_ro00501 [Rhodococcus jostii RHA1]